MSEIEIRYAKEQERSDHEHHVPTAGAMIGHITANLAVHEAQNQLMKELYAWIKEQIRLTQSFLGHEPTEGLSSAAEDDDDDAE